MATMEKKAKGYWEMRKPQGPRYLVRITCNQCGEHYILKGRLRKGRVETGFKRCLCDNRNDFEVREEPLEQV